MPWIESVRGRLGDLDLLPLLALQPVDSYAPDFITPPPDSPLPSIADELDRIRSTPPAQVRKELAILERHQGGRLHPVLEPLRTNPRRGLAKLVDAMAAYWERAIAPSWPRILALLSADLRYRATQLMERGPQGLLNEINPGVRLEGDWLQVDQNWQGSVELDGRGLLLVPAVFISRVWTIIDVEPWQPTLIYPARGVALLWQTEQHTPPELEALIGKTRAQILQALDAPRSTTELAAMLGQTAGGISQHLKVLAGSHLVASEREGRVVLYARTERADTLLTV